MKNTKANVIKLLEAMIRSRRTIEKNYREKGDKEAADYYSGQNLALQEAILALQDNEYFNNKCEIYIEETE